MRHDAARQPPRATIAARFAHFRKRSHPDDDHEASTAPIMSVRIKRSAFDHAHHILFDGIGVNIHDFHPLRQFFDAA